MHYSDTGMYSRYFDSVIGNQHHRESINIMHHRFAPDSDKAYCHCSRESGYTESKSPNWVEVGETVVDKMV